MEIGKSLFCEESLVGVVFGRMIMNMNMNVYMDGMNVVFLGCEDWEVLNDTLVRGDTYIL